MKTKREVLETYKKYGSCADIDCKACPFNKVGEECDIKRTLVKLGAEIMLENGNIEMKEMNIDALLEDYMNNPKWAGKIFMQDEKTCYIDGLIAGAKAMQEKMKCCLNCKYGGMYSEGLHCYAPREVICNKQMNEKENCCDKWELAE